MTVLSTTFRTPFFDRPATMVDLNIYCAATPLSQSMMVENYSTAAFAVVELNNHLRMHACPVVKYEGSFASAIISNGSNTEFAPRVISMELFSHFVTILPRRACPTFALRGTALTEDHYATTGLAFSPNTFLVALL